MSHRLNPCGGSFRWVWDVDRKNGGYMDGQLACNDYKRAAEVANMLWQECIKSVSYRYPGETTETLPGVIGENYQITEADFDGPLFDADFSPVQVLKSIACYSYQSCEHDEWEDSEAFAFCRALEKHAIAILPGYEEAEWGAPELSTFAMAN